MTYASLPGLRWSRLRLMAESPRAYRDAEARVTTPSMRLGRIVHAVTFGTPELAVYDGKTRQGKAWEAHLAEHGPEVSVTAPEYAKALRVRDELRADPRTAAMVTGGAHERVIQWSEPHPVQPGRSRPAKCQIDWLSTDQRTAFDLKTSADCGPRGFGVSAEKYGYRGQCAWYRRGLRSVGLDPDWLIVAVEPTTLDIAVYHVEPALLDREDIAIDRLLGDLATCEDLDVWPGKAPNVQPLRVPPWADGSVLTIGEEEVTL